MGLIGVFLAVLQGRAGSQIFSASTLFLAGMLASAAVTLFPYLLPGYPLWQNGSSAYSYPPSPAALATTLAIVIVGLALVAAYGTVVFRRLLGKDAVSSAPWASP